MSKVQEAAAPVAGWKKHAINIRLSIPHLKGRWYLTVLGGSEKRDAIRRAEERERHPLRTVGNIFFAVGLVAIFYVVVIFAMAMHTSMVEF